MFQVFEVFEVFRCSGVLVFEVWAAILAQAILDHLRGVCQPLCFCCAFCQSRQIMVGLGERFIRGRVAHNRGTSSAIRGGASRFKVQIFSSVGGRFRRAQPCAAHHQQVRHREVLCRQTEPRRTCCRGSCTCGSFGGRFTGVGRGEF